ncbi:MAG: SH3 domain-containing protein [Boseongicola sp.]
MIRALCISVFLYAAPVWATVDGWPALYDVIGVAADDVLNVRAAPNARADIIGTLDHDATAIEVIQPDEDFEWGLVNVGEQTGWASLRFLVPRPGQWHGTYPDFAWCGGTEPFWSLTRVDGRIILARIDDADVILPLEWETSSPNNFERHAFRAKGITGVLSLQACDDGMSDMRFGIELNLVLDGEDTLYNGCCSLAP